MIMSLAQLQECYCKLKVAVERITDSDSQAVYQECPSVIAYAHVDPDGNLVSQCGEISSVRDSVGRYSIAAPGADIIKVDVIEAFGTRDSITARLEGPLGPIFISEGDNGTAENVLRDRGFVVTAYGKKVFATRTTVSGESGDDDNEDFGELTDDLVNDNCQDGGGNAPFNLQVRNTTGDVISGFTTVWSSRPYSTIPGLVLPAGITHSVISNNDGTFEHVFTSSVGLNPFQSITITGGLPNPTGDNDCSQVNNYV